MRSLGITTYAEEEIESKQLVNAAAEPGVSGVIGGPQMTRRGAVARSTALLSASVLAACQMPGQTAAPRMDEREVTLTYLTDWSATGRGEWTKQAIPRFTQEFPKIKVQVEYAASALNTLILANAAGGTLQDVFQNENDVFQQLARQGELRDIAPVLKSLRVNQNDIVSLPSTHTYQGKQYGLPLQFAVQAMLINKTMFKNNGVALPDKTTTFPQWLEMLRKVARPAENIYGFTTDGSNGGWGQWLNFVWGHGGDRWSADLKKCTFDQPAAIEGLQFYADLMHRSQVATPLNAQGGMIPTGISFANGNAACAIATSPGAALDQQVAGKFEWDIMYMPLGARTGKRGVFANSNAVCASGGAAKRNVFDQAVQLVAWIAGSKTAQDLMVEIGPSMPVYKPVLNGTKYLAGPPVSQKILVDTLPDWKDPQTFIGWIDFRNAAVAAYQPALANQKSVSDAASEMTRLGQVVLDKIPK